MNKALIFKATVIWFVIACLAVGNGLIRESLIAPLLGGSIALPLSGIILSIIVFLVTYFSFNYIGVRKQFVCFLIGGQWVFMTLALELFFGHYIVGKPWSEILQTFNVTKGDLFALVLVACFLSPYLVARAKGVFNGT